MSLPNDISDRIAKMSNYDLADMLAYADDYRKEAIIIAEAEASRRNLYPSLPLENATLAP